LSGRNLACFYFCIVNIPATLLQELQGTPGFNEQAFIAAHQHKAPVSVRLHPIKGSGLFDSEEKVPWCPGGIYLPERPVFTLDPAYHTGAYYVQEASSMFLSRMLSQFIDGRTNLRVLDLCAAPGGKSTLIASLLDRDSLLVSNEVIRTRASILEENMCRWGYRNTWVTSNDPKDIGRLEGYFDIIVVDAPCSGSGLWRKDAAALNEWSEDNVNLCSGRQQRILADIWPSLKQNGILIYATCSYSPQEDEQILDWMADTFGVSHLSTTPPAGSGIEAIASPKNKMTGYRFFPHNVKGEGFFIAAMQKNDETDAPKLPKFKTARNQKIQDQASYLLSGDDTLFIPGKENTWHAINAAHEADIHLLQQVAYLRRTGLEVGSPMPKEWLPAHDIALSTDIAPELPSIDTNREQALRFLKREEMGIDNIPKGWQVVKYNGWGLGWIKGLGNRTNNYLPKHWRIRMDIDV
jgi:16S rRNA C967 or C1407 C5-methylase (RsmB/RsmF family)/NOL1/NOP2/fmu family ribosome biogenesis protein